MIMAFQHILTKQNNDMVMHLMTQDDVMSISSPEYITCYDRTCTRNHCIHIAFYISS